MSIIAQPQTVVPGATNGMLEVTWIAEARKVLAQRVQEIKGAKHNPIILGFWKEIGITWGTTDEIPWCAAFAGAMLKRGGMKYLETGMAQGYKQYVKTTKTGKILDKPCYGCLVVFWTKSPTSSEGHIGFCVGTQKGNANNLMILGGNQSDSVSIAPFSKSKVLAFIWPSISPTQERYALPVLEYAGKGSIGTR